MRLIQSLKALLSKQAIPDSKSGNARRTPGKNSLASRDFDPEDLRQACIYHAAPMDPPFQAFFDQVHSEEGDTRSIEHYFSNRPESFPNDLVQYLLAHPPQVNMEDYRWALEPSVYYTYAMVVAASLQHAGVASEVAARETEDFNFRLHLEIGREVYSYYRDAKPLVKAVPSKQEVMRNIAGLSPSSVHILYEWYDEDEEVKAQVLELYSHREGYRDYLEKWTF